MNKFNEDKDQEFLAYDLGTSFPGVDCIGRVLVGEKDGHPIYEFPKQKNGLLETNDDTPTLSKVEVISSEAFKEFIQKHGIDIKEGETYSIFDDNLTGKMYRESE